MSNRAIWVTSPMMPPLDEFVEYLEEIWASKQLTNNGPLHQRLEQALADYFGVNHVALFCNGTLALQIGLQALKISGEVITTPFSFPATTHSIYWNRCTPVFCDIDPVTHNLDPSNIESLITPNTTCIMPVHTYGTPCDVDDIKRIGDLYGLKIFYDAAHVFGEQWRGESLLAYGDLSMISFHATKVFNTIEGGALATNDPVLKQRIDYLKNFGFAGTETVVGPGGNGKMNEVQAAFGLCALKHVGRALSRRTVLAECYRNNLRGTKGLVMLPDMDSLVRNWGYFPIVVEPPLFGATRNELYVRLRAHGINARKYFYPLISSYPSYRGLPSADVARLPVAVQTADRVLCLPLYPDLTEEDVTWICERIKNP